MSLITLIALGAGVLIVLLLAIAFVVPMDDESIDKASGRTLSPRSPQRQVAIRRSQQMPALRDALPRPVTPEARTAPAWKFTRQPGWRGVAEAWTVWRRRVGHLLLFLRAWRSRRALDEGQAGWVGAAVLALSVAAGYLIAQI